MNPSQGDQPSDRVLATWAQLSARSEPSPEPLTGSYIQIRGRPRPTSSVGALVGIVIGVVVALGYLALPAREEPGQLTLSIPPTEVASGIASTGSPTPSVDASSSPSPAATEPTHPSSTPRAASPTPSPAPAATPIAMVLAGIPTTVGGESIARDLGIKGRLASSASSFLVTGRLGTTSDCVGTECPPSDASWLLPPFPLSLPYGVPSPDYVLLDDSGPWRSDGRHWSNGPYYTEKVVLRVRAYDRPCPWVSSCDRALFVEETIPPPAFVSHADGTPDVIDGQRVFYGAAIPNRIAHRIARDDEGPSFLAAGRLATAYLDCSPPCPGYRRYLVPPESPTVDINGYDLLDAEGTWNPNDARRWPNNLVVLRVRAYDLPCPWPPEYCTRSLLVEAMIPPHE